MRRQSMTLVLQSFECVLFGATALARLGDRCWAAVGPRCGDWLRPLAALLLASPPPNRAQVGNLPSHVSCHLCLSCCASLHRLLYRSALHSQMPLTLLS